MATARTTWNNSEFVLRWNSTYGRTMENDPVRQGLVFPLLRQRIQTFEGLTLYDMGCGNGNLIRFFRHEPFSNWCGIDSGSEVIKSASELQNDKRIQILEADITGTQLPVESNSADIITSVFVLDEIPIEKIQPYFESIKNILKPNGRVLIFSNHPAFVLYHSLKANFTGAENEKFAHSNAFPDEGYFGLNPLPYKLRKLECNNPSPNDDAIRAYYHKSFGEIINAANDGGLSIKHALEIPNTVKALNDLENFTPQQTNHPRYLYLELGHG